jgi:DNA-binding response OmpR family regulator
MPQPKIMIVDDDANSRGVLCDALSGECYTLLEAVNGQQAMELANRELPDVILLDIMMPGMDGNLVLHKLKEQEITRAIPVIMITALDLLDSQGGACFGAGAWDHICKPVSNIFVRSRVRAALRSRAAESTVPVVKQGQRDTLPLEV